MSLSSLRSDFKTAGKSIDILRTRLKQYQRLAPDLFVKKVDEMGASQIMAATRSLIMLLSSFEEED
jgi:hypothetical protein